jgi:hypothetical protein
VLQNQPVRLKNAMISGNCSVMEATHMYAMQLPRSAGFMRLRKATLPRANERAGNGTVALRSRMEQAYEEKSRINPQAK